MNGYYTFYYYYYIIIIKKITFLGLCTPQRCSSFENGRQVNKANTVVSRAPSAPA